MAFGSSQAVQQEEIFNMINYVGARALFFTINPTTVHHLAVSLICRKEIKLYVFYDSNLPNSKDRSM
jgi:hypothetical protein